MFFLFIIIILLILLIAIYTTKVTIEIKNFRLDTEQPKSNKINKDKEILVCISIFRKVKIFEKDLQHIKFKGKELDIKILKNKDLKLDYGELLKYISVEQIDLNAQIGTEDAALTAILTGVVSAIIGVILQKPKYEIIPAFSNKNFLKIRIDCIISIHLMQYIYKLISNKIKDLGESTLNKKVEV